MHNLKDSALLRQLCYIDGVWVDADSGTTIAVNNPATGEAIGSIPKMGAAETRRAIIAANAALRRRGSQSSLQACCPRTARARTRRFEIIHQSGASTILSVIIAKCHRGIVQRLV